MRWHLLVVTLLAVGIWQYWGNREIEQADGVLVRQQPKQVSLDSSKTISLNGYTLSPQAYFDISARVLSRENDYIGREADLSPVDFALGWGKMSDQRILDKFEISQSNRFYFWRVDDYAIARKEIISSSANMHMIPSTKLVEDGLRAVRKGHIIRIKGFLVNVDASDGWRWRTSTRRDDTGKGACELILVEEVEVIG
jgi:hypothetical protein